MLCHTDSYQSRVLDTSSLNTYTKQSSEFPGDLLGTVYTILPPLATLAKDTDVIGRMCPSGARLVCLLGSHKYEGDGSFDERQIALLQMSKSRNLNG